MAAHVPVAVVTTAVVHATATANCATATTNVSEYAVSRLVADARRVLADRRVFRLDDAAWAEWEAINDRPARDLPGLRAFRSRPSAFKD